MEKVSGICLILIGVATGVDAFTTSVAAKIAYVVILFVILAVFLFVLRTKCIKNDQKYQNYPLGKSRTPRETVTCLIRLRYPRGVFLSVFILISFGWSAGMSE